jgi:hypothetical protein
MASRPQPCTPKELWADPTLLVKRSPARSREFVPHPKFTRFLRQIICIGIPVDGRLGAVIDNGHYFLTTQNAKFIPHPPLGHCREVWLRADYRYAADDPLQWPQPYMSGNDTLAPSFSPLTSAPTLDRTLDLTT